MNTLNILPVILCGGIGKRLWPISRQDQPKQVHSFISNISLFEETLSNLSTLNFKKCLVICNEKIKLRLADLALNCPDLEVNFLCEPEPRNTAPAFIAAGLVAQKLNYSSFLVLSSDHHIPNPKNFFEPIINDQKSLLENNSYGLIGIKPTNPSTGFGYILPDNSGSKLNSSNLPVKQFIEKPNKENAEILIQKNALWNAGIFLVPTETFVSDFKLICPEVFSAVSSSINYQNENITLTTEFSKSPSISIDHAFFMKASNIRVFPTDIIWSDVGTWESIKTTLDASNTSTVKAKGTHLGSSNNYILSSLPEHSISTIGLKDITIVHTHDHTLIMKTSESQKVSQLYDKLENENSLSTRESQIGYRPWGRYETLHLSKDFRIKKIYVKPLQKLSLQNHQHREETWTVLSGSAKATRNEETITLSKGESIFIPKTAKHRLENPDKSNELVILEYQKGDYLGEDDIQRFDDDYSRI